MSNVTFLFRFFRRRLILYSLMLLTILLSASSANAQGCSTLNPTFINYEPCKFRLQLVNTTECVPPLITMVVSSGTISSWSANTNQGWNAQQTSPGVFELTYIGGFVPVGTSFPLIFSTPPGSNLSIGLSWDFDCGLGEGCVFGPISLETCPDPMDASVIGVKYRECNGLPYSNQPLLSGWTIQLFTEDGELVREDVTDNNGEYRMFDLPLGKYIVKEIAAPGWTPNVPASGQYAITLDASQQAIRNFGNCPSCSCDSITLLANQVSGNSNAGVYCLNVLNSDAYCFPSVSVNVVGGQLTGWTPNTGWTAQPAGGQVVNFIPSGGFVPLGASSPGCFNIAGAGTQSFNINASYGTPPGQVICGSPYSFMIPPPPPADTACCDDGFIPGPELVINGDFNVINPSNFNFGFVTDYTYIFPPGTPLSNGNNSILNQSQAYTVNNQWICPGLSGAGDTYLAVDGHTMANKAAWREQISVMPGTEYEFCAFARNLVRRDRNYTDPIVELWVKDGANPSVMVDQMSLSEILNTWSKLNASVTPTSNSVILEIRSSANVGLGNDFAVDKVSFRTCAPAQVCTCDSITLRVQPIGNFVEVCCYRLDVVNSSSNCFPEINLQVDAGLMITTTTPVSPWTVTTQGVQSLLLNHPSGVVPAGVYSPLEFCVAGGSVHNIFANTYYVDPAGNRVDCDKNFTFECLSTDSCSCDDNTAWDVSIRFGGGPNQVVHCGDEVQVPPGGFFQLYTNFTCQGPPNCMPARVEWQLNGPNLLTGGAQLATPSFTIPAVSPANFTDPGIYTLQMWGFCGDDTCYCRITFCVPPLPPTISDTSICRTLASAYIPLQDCPVGCDIAQVQWFVKPCSATSWPTTPYQISGGGPLANCSDLLLLPYKYPGETCVQVYAVIDLAPGCCVSQLTSNIATITLCDPISCNINNPNPAFCDVTSGLQPMSVSLSGANCGYTVEWYNDNNTLVSTALTYTPSNFGLPTGFTGCYKDFVFTVKINGICGTSTCTTSIRIYNSAADNGDLIMNPVESPSPFCPGEDFTLEYIDKCSGPPAKWTWYSSTTSATGPYAPLAGAGMMNPLWNTNQLYQTTWYMVEAKNGVCPPKQSVYKIEIKDQLVANNFTATPDPCADAYVDLLVDFIPTPASAGCQYNIDWYWNGNLIHTSMTTTSPATYQFPNPMGAGMGSMAGVYYAVVSDKCCPGSVTSNPAYVDPTCVPVISGPCFICGFGLVTLMGEMILPPQDPCPNTSGCTYQWYEIIGGVPVPIPGATGLSITVNHGGVYVFESNCNGCVRSDSHFVKQCGGTDCTVGDNEVPLPAGLEVSMFPNPTSGVFTLKLEPALLENGRLEVVRLDGQVLLMETLSNNQTEHTISLDRLSTGLYFVHLYQGEFLLWKGKIVKAE